jgi:signal transduction histidine kinase
MDKLFWRIFGSFWLLLFTLSGATLAINFLATDQGPHPGDMGPMHDSPLPFGLNTLVGETGPLPGPPPGPWAGPPQSPQNPHQLIPVSGPHEPSSSWVNHDQGPYQIILDVGNMLNAKGVTGVDQYFSTLSNVRGAQFYLFDAKGRLVAGHAPSLAAGRLAEQTIKTSRGQMAFDRDIMLHATLIKTSQKRLYVLVDCFVPPPTDWTLIIIRMVGALLMASLVCWWLAVQITKPVHILREATRNVAAGKLATRTAAQLNGRKDELGMLGKDFDQMAAKLESLISAQTRLMADISHELRSPLARLMLASAIARRSTGAQLSLTLDRVDRETERLNELIGQLTSLAQLELGSARVSSQEIELHGLIDQVINSVDYEANDKLCSITCSYENCEAVIIRGDPELLRRAIENVVRNAVLYTAERTQVDLKIQKAAYAGVLRIIVSDCGPGVPDDEIHSIFNPFYRTSVARDRESGGVGLGLAIAKRAALHHGGDITAFNRTDKIAGLTVVITLPAATNSDEPQMPDDSALSLAGIQQQQLTSQDM